MSISYIDIVKTMEQAHAGGRTVDHVVITEETKENFMENMAVADTEGSIGTANSFDVQVGDEHKLVTTDGQEFAIK
jgi:hypothetical protein